MGTAPHTLWNCWVMTGTGGTRTGPEIPTGPVFPPPAGDTGPVNESP